jgi:hypothetical protein
MRRTSRSSRPLRAQDRCYFEAVLCSALAAAERHAVGLARSHLYGTMEAVPPGLARHTSAIGSKGERTMIDHTWLGYYGDDSDDDSMHRLHLFVSSSDVLCYEYYYESRSNHGYDIVFHEGTVQSIVDNELVIDSTYRHEDSWEDWFKEHRRETGTVAQTRIIKIKPGEHNQPILLHEGTELSFRCTDSFGYSSLFARVRADIARLHKKDDMPDK